MAKETQLVTLYTCVIARTISWVPKAGTVKFATAACKRKLILNRPITQNLHDQELNMTFAAPFLSPRGKRLQDISRSSGQPERTLA